MVKKYCLPGRDGRDSIHAGHFVPGYARFTRYCLPGMKMRAGLKPAPTMDCDFIEEIRFAFVKTAMSFDYNDFFVLFC